MVPWVVIVATIAFAGLLAYEQLVARAETVSSLDKLHSTKIELWPMLWEGIAPSGRSAWARVHSSSASRGEPASGSTSRSRTPRTCRSIRR
ncbi:MAG: hypothetical protein U0228_05800 [Myxococcaceae bacterium]